MIVGKRINSMENTQTVSEAGCQMRCVSYGVRRGLGEIGRDQKCIG